MNCADSYYTANLKGFIHSLLGEMAISPSLLEVLYFANTSGQKDGTQVEPHSSVPFMRILVN